MRAVGPVGAARAAQRLRIQVVDAQLGHDVGVQRHLQPAPAAAHDDIGHHGVGFGVLERAAGLGLALLNQRLRLAQQFLAGTGECAQALEVALGQQLQMLLADQQRQRLRRAARTGAQLQAQAFGQVARAHARRLHAVQPVQRALQARAQILVRLGVVDRHAQHLGQPRGDVVQRVGQVAVAVQRLDQDLQRSAVLAAQAHAGHLPAQVLLQRDRAAAALELAVVRVGRGAAVEAGGLADAVEVVALGTVLPVLALGGAEVVGLDLGKCAVAAVAAVEIVALRRRIGLGFGAFRRRGVEGQRLVVGFEEGVQLEHLLDFLLQLQCRQLQQPDRLLQLRRQRQMLRQADLQGRLHGNQQRCRSAVPARCTAALRAAAVEPASPGHWRALRAAPRLPPWLLDRRGRFPEPSTSSLAPLEGAESGRGTVPADCSSPARAGRHASRPAREARRGWPMFTCGSSRPGTPCAPGRCR